MSVERSLTTPDTPSSLKMYIPLAYAISKPDSILLGVLRSGKYLHRSTSDSIGELQKTSLLTIQSDAMSDVVIIRLPMQYIQMKVETVRSLQLLLAGLRFVKLYIYIYNLNLNK